MTPSDTGTDLVQSYLHYVELDFPRRLCCGEKNLLTMLLSTTHLSSPLRHPMGFYFVDCTNNFTPDDSFQSFRMSLS
jgi:hypothetical protein